MATHSSVLAWRIPWTEEPGGLQSVESQSQTQLSNFHLCSSAATLASLLLLKPGDLVLASGPLHLLFCLPGVLLPQILHSSLSHFFHISVESRLGRASPVHPSSL